MEHQSPDLDTLPSLAVRRLGIHKGRVRHPPRPAIQLRVVALDQRHLARGLAIGVEPLVRLVRFHCNSAPVSQPAGRHRQSQQSVQESAEKKGSTKRTTQRLPPPIWIDQPDGHKIPLGHAPGLGHRERVLEDGPDGPPHVDDLDAAPQQPLRLVG